LIPAANTGKQQIVPEIRLLIPSQFSVHPSFCQSMPHSSGR